MNSYVHVHVWNSAENNIHHLIPNMEPTMNLKGCSLKSFLPRLINEVLEQLVLDNN